MVNFTPGLSLAGGLLIGLSATGMLLLLGRVTGVSGILGGLLAREETGWRGSFIAGLLAGGALTAAFQPGMLAMTLDRSSPSLAVAGLLVGFGSRLGSGCTSGHGVCGIARASRRSIVATATFMTTGAAAAFVITQFLGGRL